MLKRVIDLVLLVLTVPLWFPLLVITAIAVRIFLGSPVFFHQIRAGQDGRPFCLIKFRTMRDLRGPDGTLLEDSLRLTPFGIWLRSTSLDELPELLLVLLGKMSLVGPRPLLLEYNARYSAEQSLRLQALPGLTGWAQINGRNTTTWNDRFALDAWYVKNRSWWLDLKIIARTVSLVLRREGVNAPGHATMKEFKPELTAGHPPKS